MGGPAVHALPGRSGYPRKHEKRFILHGGIAGVPGE